MPVLPEPPKRSPTDPVKPGGPQRPNWLSSFPWWYLLLILAAVWLWQDYLMSYGRAVKTIPYSQFKADLREAR